MNEKIVFACVYISIRVFTLITSSFIFLHYLNIFKINNRLFVGDPYSTLFIVPSRESKLQRFPDRYRKINPSHPR